MITAGHLRKLLEEWHPDYVVEAELKLHNVLLTGWNRDLNQRLAIFIGVPQPPEE